MSNQPACHGFRNCNGRSLDYISSLTTSVGPLGEIFRLGLRVSPGSRRARISDSYTKADGQAGYGAIFALSSDHELGFSVNVAGGSAGSERWNLRSAVAETFVVAAEHVAAANAARNFAGMHTDPDSENTNITLSVDVDRPGLGLDTFFVEGVDWRANISAPFGHRCDTQREPQYPLYPNGIVAPDGEVGFSGVPEVPPPGEWSALEGGTGLFDLGRGTWTSLGFFSYQGGWLESFIINVVGGRALNIFARTSEQV